MRVLLPRLNYIFNAYDQTPIATIHETVIGHDFCHAYWKFDIVYPAVESISISLLTSVDSLVDWGKSSTIGSHLIQYYPFHYYNFIRENLYFP